MEKKKSFSTVVWLLILQEKWNELSNRQLGRQFGCSEEAVHDLIKQEVDTRSVRTILGLADRPR